MMLKYILLGLLDYQAMTGYELENWISVSAGNFWAAKLSQIYTTLKGLEEEALVISHIEPQEGRPDKRIYEITKAGRRDLKAWLLEPVTALDVKKDSLLVKVFFYEPGEKEALLTVLRLQLHLHQQKLAEYQKQAPDAILEMLQQNPRLMPNAELWEATRQFGMQYEAMYIEWLKTTIKQLGGS
jgi:PadR family transcriptional regulator, regulatory protein AphA